MQHGKFSIQTTDSEGAINIVFPSTLGNPLRVSELWSKEFVQKNYLKYLNLKIKDRDELTINKLNYIAEQIMDGKNVVLLQSTEDVHGEVLAKFIMDTINA